MERGSKDKAYLTVNILLFLAPFALLKREYAEVINKCLYRETWYQKYNVVKDIIEHTVFVYRDGVYLSNVVMCMKSLTGSRFKAESLAMG